MSHVTDLKLKVRDLDALADGCEVLGLEFLRDQQTCAYWGRYERDSTAFGPDYPPEKWGTCAHAIKVKGTTPRMGAGGPWEIAVVKAADGDGYSLHYDTFGSAGAALTENVGPNANRLRQEYAAAVARKRAAKKLKGWRMSREELPAGRVRLRLRLRKR